MDELGVGEIEQGAHRGFAEKDLKPLLSAISLDCNLRDILVHANIKKLTTHLLQPWGPVSLYLGISVLISLLLSLTSPFFVH